MNADVFGGLNAGEPLSNEGIWAQKFDIFDKYHATDDSDSTEDSSSEDAGDELERKAENNDEKVTDILPPSDVKVTSAFSDRAMIVLRVIFHLIFYRSLPYDRKSFGSTGFANINSKPFTLSSNWRSTLPYWWAQDKAKQFP